MAAHRGLDDRETHVWQGYLAAQRELLGALERQNLRESGLSGAEYAVLVPLSESEDGVLRARELGAALDWDRSRLAHQVRRMEKRGLLTRGVCAADARGSMVGLTEAGRSAIETAAPAHVAQVRRCFFDHLSDAEVDTLGAVFDRLLAALAEE
jgi:DNA-binding MarR family transcriptional regulator